MRSAEKAILILEKLKEHVERTSVVDSMGSGEWPTLSSIRFASLSDYFVSKNYSHRAMTAGAKPRSKIGPKATDNKRLWEKSRLEQHTSRAERRKRNSQSRPGLFSVIDKAYR